MASSKDGCYLVQINVQDATHSSVKCDEVILAAPNVRATTTHAGWVTTTTPITVKLDNNGQGSVYLEPGPVVVWFRCKGIFDNKPFEVTVPKPPVGARNPTITLQALMENKYTYRPDVATYIERLLADANEALTGAVKAQNSANSERVLAEAANKSAQAAAGRAAGSENNAKQSADAAKNAATRSEQAATTAATKAATETSNNIRAEFTELKTAAESAKTAAQSAQNKAETAATTTAADTAKKTADNLRSEFTALKTAAEAAEVAAQSAKTGAQTASSSAEAAQTAAERAATRAETAQTGAVTARNLAQTYRNTAQSAATTATQQANTAGTYANTVAVDRSATAAAQIAAEAARDEAVKAAEDAKQSAANAVAHAPADGWVKAQLSLEVQALLDKADTANTALNNKANIIHTHAVTDIEGAPSYAKPPSPNINSNALVMRNSGGQVSVPITPSNTTDAASKSYVDKVAGKVDDGTVTTSKIVDGAVTGAKIGERAINRENLPYGLIYRSFKNDTEPAEDNGMYVYTKNASSGAWTFERLRNYVDTTLLKDKAVTTDKLADKSVTQDKLAEGTIFFNPDTTKTDKTIAQYAGESGRSRTDSGLVAKSGDNISTAKGVVSSTNLSCGIPFFISSNTDRLNSYDSSGLCTNYYNGRDWVYGVAKNIISTTNLVNGSVTTNKLAAGAVTSAKMYNDTNIFKISMNTGLTRTWENQTDPMAGFLNDSSAGTIHVIRRNGWVTVHWFSVHYNHRGYLEKSNVLPVWARPAYQVNFTVSNTGEPAGTALVSINTDGGFGNLGRLNGRGHTWGEVTYLPGH